MEQSEQDFRKIERERDLPPDELYPRYEQEDDEDENEDES
jgi:hypothetical protein